ncbi:unnamed protein product, partial [Ixodes hexagonus]
MASTVTAASTSGDHGGGYVSVWLRPPEQQQAASKLASARVRTRWAVPATAGVVGLLTLLPSLATCLLSACLPLWTVLSAHYWFCLLTRRTFRASDGFVVALAGVVSDLSAGATLPYPVGPLTSTVVWAVVCLCACSVAAPRALHVLPSLAGLRLLSLVAFGELVRPAWVRAVVGHLCGVVGLLAARFTESEVRGSHVSALVSPDGRLLAVRRRRTGSSPALHGLVKGRRTSLPVLGGQRTYYGPWYQV